MADKNFTIREGVEVTETVIASIAGEKSGKVQENVN